MTTVCIDLGCGDWEYITTKADGDTLIDGSSYRIMVSGNTPMTTGACCSPEEVLPRAYVLEDTVSRKVYLRSPQIVSDSLLYDFGLDVGDTLKGYLASYSTTPLSVLSIDSVLVAGAYHRRINFDTTTSTCSRFAMIEGVGATTGLLACYSEPWDSGILLQCLTVDDTIQYYAPCSPDTAGCAAIPVGVGAPTVAGQGSNGCRLTYVPSGSLEVHCDQDHLPLEISIIDSAGRTSLTGSIASSRSSIHVGDLPTGLYCVRVVDRNEAVLTAQKLVLP